MIHRPPTTSDQLQASINNHRPADSAADNWVDLYAPGFSKPYLRLMRADRPIGTWLLLLPCWFGLALGVAVTEPGAISLSRALVMATLFAIGAFVMRGAGCVYNDIVDRNIDAKVHRTALRPIPSGDVSVRQALLFLLTLCLIGLVVLLQFNSVSILTGISSLALVAAYPFMKRITWWPQLWLGLTFNWGILVGFTAVAGKFHGAALCLFIACMFWTLGYDTIYAHQDREDDALIGVKSSARRLGEQTQKGLLVFYGCVLFLINVSILLTGAPFWIILITLPAGAHLAWQIRTLNINDGHNCLRLFKSNRSAGFLLLLPLILNVAIR